MEKVAYSCNLNNVQSPGTVAAADPYEYKSLCDIIRYGCHALGYFIAFLMAYCSLFLLTYIVVSIVLTDI